MCIIEYLPILARIVFKSPLGLCRLQVIRTIHRLVRSLQRTLLRMLKSQFLKKTTIFFIK